MCAYSGVNKALISGVRSGGGVVLCCVYTQHLSMMNTQATFNSVQSRLLELQFVLQSITKYMFVSWLRISGLETPIAADVQYQLQQL